MAITNFPNDAVCFILVDIPGEGEFQGSGAIIGPHTILTAAHLLYDADTGATADRVSVYPGYVPQGSSYNPPGALPGNQTIHTLPVHDNGDELSARGTQRDFAVIDTSTDLSQYGSFALDPSYTSGDIVVNGYPAADRGYQAGTGGVLSQDGPLSDIDTSGLALAPGYSGGPLWDRVERDGSVVPAVVGTVSTDDDATKLTHAKVGLIRHWIASDELLYAGGVGSNPLVPQIAGTVASSVNAAVVSRSSQAATLAAAIVTGPSASGDADTALAATAARHRPAGHQVDLGGTTHTAEWGVAGLHGDLAGGGGMMPFHPVHHGFLTGG